MNIKELIQKITDKLKPNGVRAIFSREARVIFHWKILLIIFFILLIVIIFTSLTTYREVNNDELATVKKNSISENDLATVEHLNSVNDYFTQKKVIFEQLQDGGDIPIDPSR